MFSSWLIASKTRSNEKLDIIVDFPRFLSIIDQISTHRAFIRISPTVFMRTLGEVAEETTGIALMIFASVVGVLILTAGSIDVVGERLARFVTAVALTLAPTSQLAIVISVISALVAGISVSKLPGSTVVKIGGAILLWQLFSLTLNYLTAPV